MALTLRKLFSPPITRQYPQERPPMYSGFRGQHALVRDAANGGSKCVACMRCAQVCPSRCIRISFHEEGKQRIMDEYAIDALRCVFCGYCVEVCPVNAVTMTEVFEYSSFTRDEMYYKKDDLLANWDRFVQEASITDDYVNPLWRPRGIPEQDLPAAKRLAVPEDWTIEGQYVGSEVSDRGESTHLKESDDVC